MMYLYHLRMLLIPIVALFPLWASAATVQIDWDHDGPAPTGYGVERQINGGLWAYIGGTTTDHFLVDTGASTPKTCWRAYAYTLIEWQWYFSQYSETYCLEAPTVPLHLSALVGGGASPQPKTVQLTWETEPVSEQSFRIYRKLGVGAYSVAAETEVFTFEDMQSSGASVCRYVQSFNPLGVSAPSHEICLTTPDIPVHDRISTIGPDAANPATVVTIGIRRK